MPYTAEGVGYRHTDTSRAAVPQSRKALLLRSLVFGAIYEGGPMTCDDVARKLSISPLSTRPRLTELRKLGWIKDSGKRRTLDSGKSGIVWEVVS